MHFVKGLANYIKYVLNIIDSNHGLYAWKSLLKGREMIMRGARWRIGTRDAISIWNDAWLPSLVHPRILSPVVTDYSNSSARSLIFPFSNSWNLELLTNLFSTQEVDMIMRIPLSHFLMEDTLVWPHVSLGDYFVKSSYIFFFFI